MQINEAAHKSSICLYWTPLSSVLCWKMCVGFNKVYQINKIAGAYAVTKSNVSCSLHSFLSLSLSLSSISFCELCRGAGSLEFVFHFICVSKPHGNFWPRNKICVGDFFLLLKSCTMSCIRRIVCILTRSSSLCCIRGVDREGII